MHIPASWYLSSKQLLWFYSCQSFHFSLLYTQDPPSTLMQNCDIFLAILSPSIGQVTLEREVLMQGFRSSHAQTLNRKDDRMKTVLN